MPFEPAEGIARHLHPVSLLFSLGSAAWRLLVPALLFVLLSRGEAVELWLGILFGPAALHAIVRYATFRYRFDRDDLVVRQGLVFRSERHIPYARIQSVDLVQNILQRAAGVAEVRVQTASGEEAEAIFKVLALDAVEEMRRRVFRGREVALALGEASAPAAERLEVRPVRRVLATMPPAEIVLYGLISNRGMVVVAALFGLYWQLAYWGEGRAPRIDPGALSRLPALPPGGAGVVLALAALLALFVLVRMLSMGHALLTYHGFRLEAAGDDLRVSAGLFTRVSATIPRHRIQTVTLRESPLHRLFGRVSIRVQTAGGHAGEAEDVHKEDWLVPLIRKDRLPSLMRDVQPELDLDALDWRPVDRRAARRLFVRRAAVALAVTAGAVAWLGAMGAWALVVIPFSALSARWEAKSLGWALGPSAIAVREGWWTRTTTAARYGKIQAVVVRETPIDRRLEMASLAVDTAGARRVARALCVPFLDRSTAIAAYRSLEASVAETTFRW